MIHLFFLIETTNDLPPSNHLSHGTSAVGVAERMLLLCVVLTQCSVQAL
jgi:hypothetical protein